MSGPISLLSKLFISLYLITPAVVSHMFSPSFPNTPPSATQGAADKDTSKATKPTKTAEQPELPPEPTSEQNLTVPINKADWAYESDDDDYFELDPAKRQNEEVLEGEPDLTEEDEMDAWYGRLRMPPTGYIADGRLYPRIG
ncbi:hypothetical protein BCR34DRAFT_54257 [Clohesyomyces aquaticus]|uniref:Uncharacterized protein n=1 Tax=Clohesyomyces aquaticus TaxID=1231657 RepID=A0A1Y1Z386_9PLEO|nr:hypothetical protein BCR34DRAFT_54257 [Clohesyomyces aquaticus]